MFKKLLSGLTALVIAATILPTVALAGGGYEDALSVTSDSFNPTATERIKINFQLYSDANIKLEAVNLDSGQYYTIQDYINETAGYKTYDWYGKTLNSSNGSPLPNGDYQINLYVWQNGFDVRTDQYTVNLYGATSDGGGNSGSGPAIFSLNTALFSINPSQGESTTLSFYVAEDAWIDAYIKDSNGTVVRDFSQYENTFTYNSSNGTYRSVIWHGVDDGGYPLSDGTYYFYVDAFNSYGKSNGNIISLQISGTSSITAPTVSNAYSSPTTINPDNGEYSKFSFEVAQDAKITATVVDSYGNYVAALSGFNSTLYNNSTYGTTYNAYWYGYDDYGNKVPDGTYYFTADALNDQGSDSLTSKVTVKSDSYPNVLNLKVSPSTFDPENNEKTKATFKVVKDAYVTAYIKKGSTTYKTFYNYNNKFFSGSKSTRSIWWDGRDDYGNYVDDGIYKFYVNTSYNGKSDTDYVNVSVDTDNDPYYNSKNIKSMSLSPSSTWDPSNKELDINFTLKKTVYDLNITATKAGAKIVKIYNDPNYSYGNGSYSFTWNGRDKYGNYVDAGTWKIVVNAGGDKVTKKVKVKYGADNADIEAYVTKKEFDPAQGEVTTLLFKVDEDAEVDVEIMNSKKLEKVLWNNVDVDKYKWYSVVWDGKKNNGKYVNYNNNWRFKITVNGNNYLVDTKYVNANIKKDTAGNKVANVTDDHTQPVVFDDKKASAMDISFCIDGSATMSLNIYKNTAGTGKKVATIIKGDKFKSGCHTVKWNVDDNYYNDLKDGIYSYKLISKTSYNYKDTETGKFVIGNAGNILKKKKKTSKKCGGYWDLGTLNSNSELCDAIKWSKHEGIFSGYSDGSFKKNDTINRAEVLKVVLEAFNVKLLSSKGSKLEFSDVNPNAWYMTYVMTAKVNGLLEGYANSNKAGMTDDINRAEMLKFVMEASDAFAGYELSTGYAYAYVYSDVSPSKWYYKYAVESYKNNLFDSVMVGGKKYLKPSQLVRRGEVALLLYRMQKAGLL